MESNRRSMTRRFVLRLVVMAGGLVGVVTAVGRPAADPPVGILKEVKRAAADLTDKQALVLDRLKRAPTTVGEVRMFEFQEGVLTADAAAVPLTLPLAGGKVFSVEKVGVFRDAGKPSVRLAWAGQGARRAETVTLVARDKSVSGLVYADKKVFAVEPLGGGLHALVEVDQTKFPPDHPPGAHKEGDQKDKPKGDAADIAAVDRPSPDTAPLVLRALVAYTPKVDELEADIAVLIDAAVEVTNTSYRNSGVNLRMELAHTVRVAYVESATHDTDLGRFKGKADGVMDEVHTLRNDYAADVCVLLINNPSFCGLAAGILATEDTAFAVVHHACAVKNLSFAHEVGHLQGARHNPEVDGTTSPFPFGHGYLNPGGGWRTIMAYPSTANPTRTPFWSSPRVMYPGTMTPMGTVGLHDNARGLNATAATITAFRP